MTAKKLPKTITVTEEFTDYQLTSNENKEPGIRCKECGMISYNTNDIEHAYCGHCHKWHNRD